VWTFFEPRGSGILLFLLGYKEALESEDGVVGVFGDALYQVYKDGTKVKIKDIPPRFKVDPTKQYILKV